jgi:hypothetical protein
MFTQKNVASVLLLIASFAPAAYPATTNFRLKGNSVTANFVDPNPGCVFTSAGVFASEETSHIPGNPKQFTGSALVSLVRFDSCTGQILLDALGLQPLTGSNLQVAPSLQTAALNVNVTLFDLVSGTSVDVAIALTWTATEGVFSGHSMSRSRFPGFSTHFRFSGTTRQAQAVGTVSALGTNFASAPSVFADISKVQSGSVSITRGQ